MRLVYETIVQSFIPPYRGKDILKQIHFVAVESAPVVAFCLSFAAIVTIIESSFHMKIVIGNDSLVPGFAALLILRELGAVVTALLVTSRVGAGLAAEIGTMKITEQIDALKMLGINPIRFIAVPRLIACIVSGMLLTVLANSVCLVAAMLVSQIKLGYTSGAFMVGMRTFVNFNDMIFSIIKGAAFGAVIPLFSCYFGFRCKSGAEGVGLATTNSVVATSVAIIIIDFVLSWIFSYLY
ncbi:MAG: ABC transporter permease [Bdellovibrionales bacterium]|nr:ABC transporter permease [Bdellovibrionales bacterium]